MSLLDLFFPSLAWRRRLTASPRSILRQARLALGARGVAWISIAGTLGLLCCAVACIDIALSFGESDLDRHQARVAGTRKLDETYRELTWALATTMDALEPGSGAVRIPRQALVSFTTALDVVCKDFGDGLSGQSLRQACKDDGFLRQLRSYSAASDTLVRLESVSVRDLRELHDNIHELDALANVDTNQLLARTARSHRTTMLVLAASTAGFMGVGFLLLLLVGRACLQQSDQSHRAAEAAELLRETIEALPAGVVVYDSEERLTMFNAVAAEITPALLTHNGLGKTYEQMAHESGQRLEAAGHGPQPVAEWIARFRRKDTKRERQTGDGRWFEWSERATPSGRTVGMRVDVTEIKNKELEVEHERARYQSLVDSLSDMVYAFDAKGIFTYASPAVSDLLGVPAAKLIGTRFRDWVVAEDVEQVMQAGRQFHHSPNRKMRQMQFRMKAADGTLRSVELRYRKPVGDELTGAQVGVIRDISERVELQRRLEDQLAELERARAEYRSLVDSLSDVVYKIDGETGIITFASAAAADFFGAPIDEIVGTHFLERAAPEFHPALVTLARREIGPDDPATTIRVRVRAAGGEMRHVEARARRRLDEHGHPIVTGVLRDVEESVQLEWRLEQERARLRSIVESSGAMMVLVDSALNVTMVNSGFTLMTGVAEEMAVGRPLNEILTLPLDRTVAEPTHFTVEVNDKHGHIRLISVTATPVTTSAGDVESIVLLGVDDTQRRDAEQALHDAERFATIGEMAGAMAHELSQPLQVINIACAAARDELTETRDQGSLPDNEYVQQRLDRIAQQVEGASRIVGDLRAFVRGTSSERPELFDPASAMRNAINLTSYGMHQAGAALTETMPGELPMVSGDIGRLEQVLVNLLNNARDAGGPVIGIVADTVQRDDQPFVRIAVEDSGPGIPEEMLSRLFVSFVTTKPRGQGTGLGLRICRRIVEEMGGSICGTNRTEGGARFEVLLPAAPVGGTLGVARQAAAHDHQPLSLTR